MRLKNKTLVCFCSMMIPTVAGLPINIFVNGTGTFDLVLNGKMDVRKVSSSPRSLDIDGEIRPRYMTPFSPF